MSYLNLFFAELCGWGTWAGRCTGACLSVDGGLLPGLSELGCRGNGDAEQLNEQRNETRMTTSTTTTILGLASSVFTNLNYFKTFQWTMGRTKDKCINSQSNDNCRVRFLFLLFKIQLKIQHEKLLTIKQRVKNISKIILRQLWSKWDNRKTEYF